MIILPNSEEGKRVSKELASRSLEQARLSPLLQPGEIVTMRSEDEATPKMDEGPSLLNPSMLPEGEFLKSASIMVDVDALFDTRASLLDMLHPRILAMALATGYETREEDAFHKVGFEKFKKIYEARDVRCLEDAPITAIASILMSFARETLAAAVESPAKEVVQIYVNVWPYKLGKAQAEKLGKLVSRFTAEILPVKVVSMSPEALTPTWCRANLEMLIKYDWEVWADVHAKSNAWRNVQMTEICVIAPRLYLKGKPSDTELEAFKTMHKSDPFTYVERGASTLFSLNYLPAKHFSMRINEEIIAAQYNIAMQTPW